MLISFNPKNNPAPDSGPPKKLLDLVREEIRIRNYSYRTEQTYVDWIKRFIFFHQKRHPKEMGTAEVKKYLSYLALERNVAASTQNQAFNALLFLYKQVLKINLGNLDDIPRAKGPARLPTVLTSQETQRLLSSMNGVQKLICSLLYDAGLRVMEGLRLRVKDMDFERNTITIKDGKGGKDRVTMLPASLKKVLIEHLRWVRLLHEADLKKGRGQVHLPSALRLKYPNLDRAWGWQYVFPAAGLSTDPRSGTIGRHHIHESAVQKALKTAVGLVGINKHVQTTMIYTHVLNRPGVSVKSPLDRL